MPSPQAREAGCVWTASGQRLQVLVQGGDVIVGGVALGSREREAFARAFFLACYEADGNAEEEAAVPP